MSTNLERWACLFTTDIEVTTGIGKRLQEYVELAELQLSGCLLLSNERKNQTKVDLLIHQGRIWTFSLFCLE